MNLVSDLQWHQILPLPATQLLVDIFSLNEHMGLLILVCIIAIDSIKEQWLFDLHTLTRCHYYSY